MPSTEITNAVLSNHVPFFKAQKNADDNADDERENDGDHRQQHRFRESLANDFRHGTLALIRTA
jgi:hypothetical protein